MLQGESDIDRRCFEAPDESLIEELGGILERAFQREGGKEPNEEELQRYIGLAIEVEAQARAYEALSSEYKRELERAEADAGVERFPARIEKIERLRSEWVWSRERASELARMRRELGDYLARFG